MKTLFDSCVPRQSVFKSSYSDIVLDLTNLIQDKVDTEAFFSENFITDGMKTLLQKSFERLQGKSDQGIFLLQQAMGGGKTHSLFALGLLAKYPEIRSKVLEDIVPGVDNKAIRVAAFTGREVDAPLGIWGAIADQLGKKSEFNDYYSPLSAPGQSAWINLLKGDPLLILLDELPPYFENAESRQIGDSNLAKVSQAALSTLFNAVTKEELSNVCIIVTDLRASYEGGSGRIVKALEDLAKETGRTALPLEPVRMNTNEIYHILNTRLFESLPGKESIDQVAEGYGKSLRDANEMDLTSASPESHVSAIRASYPFHPGLRDLYARFKENPGFQQTRGLIRLMRLVVANMWEKSGAAKERYLVSPFDVDLNDASISSEIKSINPHLGSAIAHDIANEGNSIAEQLEIERKSNNVQDACKCLLVSSLANVPNATVGLTMSELVHYLSAPNRDLTKLRDDIALLSTKAWYLHTNREQRRYFKNVENLNAKLKAQAESFSQESRVKKIRETLERYFSPQLKDCYQEITVLPSIDDIEPKQDKVMLVVFEPYRDTTLHPDLKKFWEDCQFKNRICFLTGSADTMASVYNTAAELRAIEEIIGALKSEKIPDNDPQMIESKDLADKLAHQFNAAVRETFTTLVYPHKDELRTADFLMQFEGNAYNGEKQIRQTLMERQKFTEDVTGSSFQKKCEVRLFGNQKERRWTDVKRQAATSTEWQWHKSDALDSLKDEMSSKDFWRLNGDYVEKGPFPPPATEVRIKEKHRDDDTGEVILRVDPVRGDRVSWRKHGSQDDWRVIENLQTFKTNELKLEFVCEDSQAKHQKGDPYLWTNTITVKSKTFQDGANRKIELKAAPSAQIKYTIDGTSPKNNGKQYEAPFEIDKACQVVLAIAEAEGIISDEHTRPIDWNSAIDAVSIDPEQAVIWKRAHTAESTAEAFEMLQNFEKYQCTAVDPYLEIQDGQRWITIQFGDNFGVEIAQVKQVLNILRNNILQGEIRLSVDKLRFPKGALLNSLVSNLKDEIKQGEVEQFNDSREAA